MSWKFITNINTQLSEYITNTLPDTEKFQALVGYFYFSGFAELYNGLKEKKVEILVGMNTDMLTYEVVELQRDFEGKWIANIRSTFISKLTEQINKAEYFDTKEAKEWFDVFLKKIEDKTLELRQCKEPNHSKLYLFHYYPDRSQNGQQPGMLITWSSNLTKPGLVGRYELNAEFRDKQTFEEWKVIFEELRDEATPITKWWEDDPLLVAIKEKTWLQLPTPYECYIKMLHEYFEVNEEVSTPHQINPDYKDVKYQIDAIKKGIQVINQHNWVIIADVVGLWKSIIGSMIIHNLQKKEKGKAIIIAKPHLVPQWNDYKKYLDFDAEVYSSGDLTTPLDDIENKIRYAPIVLVDEAHKFRNDDTKDYQLLDRICKGRKVILLTATPFNNAPNDVFNLVKLYEIPKQSTLEKGLNLGLKFKELQKEYEFARKRRRNNKKDQSISEGIRIKTEEEITTLINEIAGKIRNLISPFLIRRSRLDLLEIEEYRKDLEEQWYDFSRSNSPRLWNFDVGALEQLYVETLDKLLASSNETQWNEDESVESQIAELKERPFTTARYTPLLYIRDDLKEQYQKILEKSFWTNYSLVKGRQMNMPIFIRRLLVSRFESSIFAFKQTLSNMQRVYGSIIERAEKHQSFLLIRKGNLDKILKLEQQDQDDAHIHFDPIELDDDSINALNQDDALFSSLTEAQKAKLEKSMWFEIKLQDMDPQFMQNLKKDQQFLSDLHNEWALVETDPKLDYIKMQIDSIFQENEINPDYKGRKIIIFSQYADTIDYLEDKLSSAYRVLSITWGTKNKHMLNTIAQNFDAWLVPSNRKDDFDILLATDAVSEWYNLHRAGVIINYDIPYNPTIVIQRAGRINRINKKVYPELFIYNNFPSLIGQQHYWVEDISKLKISMINTILGNDTKTISDEEELCSYYTKLMEDYEQQEGKSRDNEYFNEYVAIKKNNLELFEKAISLPDKIRVQRHSDDLNAIITFAKKGKYKQFKMADTTDGLVTSLSYENAFKYLRATNDELGKEVSADFYDYYHVLKSTLFVNDTSEDEANLTISRALGIIRNYESFFPTEYVYKLKKVLVEWWYDVKYYLSAIRDFKSATIEQQIRTFIEECPIDHLNRIIATMENINQWDETIIISEEFTQ
jgi:ERCC4-related helicase